MSDPNGGSKVVTPSGHLGNVPAHHGGAARGHLLLGHRDCPDVEAFKGERITSRAISLLPGSSQHLRKPQG